VIHWDVGQLAVSLRAIAAAEPLVEALERFASAYESAIAERFCWRLGVSRADATTDRALVLAAERFMVASGMRIDRFFIDWAGGRIPAGEDTPERQALADALAGRTATRGDWWETAAPQSMPIEEVETIWAVIAEPDDWQPLNNKVAAIRAMGAALAA
ncbi:MAG: protein adenylyltransferase SelO family protein, partial [Sphingopyxis sp.]|nr:protein adenylyltransferase SelO family protein [Sphingopyxis sp.]